jgi:hypothetical protein
MVWTPVRTNCQRGHHTASAHWVLPSQPCTLYLPPHTGGLSLACHGWGKHMAYLCRPCAAAALSSGGCIGAKKMSQRILRKLAVIDPLDGSLCSAF